MLARELAGSVRSTTVQSKWDQIKVQLKAVADNESQLTRKQLDRVIAEYESDKPEDNELKHLIKQVKEKLVPVG